MNKKVLFITSVYRIGERIYPIIPKLKEKLFDIDLIKVNEMSSEMSWYGTIDPRTSFDNLYSKHIGNTFDVGFNGFKDKNININLSEYDIIISDDSRARYGLNNLYDLASKLNIPMLGSIHGGGRGYGSKDYNSGYKKVFDYLMVFGNMDIEAHNIGDKLLKMGIPSNDILKDYNKSEDYILCVTNFLANHWVKLNSCPLRVDEKYVENLGLAELQGEFNKKVIFKIKTRKDNPNPNEDMDYMRSIINPYLDYEIMMDVEDDNSLISDSFIVLSPPSTLAFKSIQQGIPTVLINKAGILGHFRDYKGLVDLDTQQIFDEVERQYQSEKESDFIESTIEGGLDFTSTDKCINEIMSVLQ